MVTMMMIVLMRIRAFACCRLDIDTCVPIYNDAGASLGKLIVRLRPSMKANPHDINTYTPATNVPKDVDDLSDDEVEDMKKLDGSFIWIHLSSAVMCAEKGSDRNDIHVHQNKYRLAYSFFQSQPHVAPIEHEHVNKY